MIRRRPGRVNLPGEMSAFDIRHLTSRDIDAMHGLLTMFGEAFHERETYGAHRPDDAYVRRLLDSDGFIALVAETGGEVVGGLAAYVLHKFEQARSEIYIYDLAVAESYRRQGIATALIERLRQIGRTRGAWVVYVQADHGDEPAIALYTKLGVREDVLHFDIAIDGPAASD